MSGVEVIRSVRQQEDRANFVALTNYDGDEDIHEALEAGAGGYLIKGMPAATLLDALRRSMPGIATCPIPWQKSSSRECRTPISVRASAKCWRSSVAGKSNKEIAAVLGISRATVKCHVSVIFSSIGVEDRTQAAVAALQRGLVRL